MIEQIVPAPVVTVDVFGDAGADLFPEEAAYIAAAVHKRRSEFATVRQCARQALARLGVDAVPILPGSSGAPRWPSGVVGSMTHCAGYGAAAVAMGEHVATIGIDAEPHGRLPDNILDLVALAAERIHLGDLAAVHPSVHWDRLLFSAKESVYKAWFPLTGAWLGFEDAEVVFDSAGTFTAQLLVPGPVMGGRPLSVFDGRYVVSRDLVATAIVVPATGKSAAAQR